MAKKNTRKKPSLSNAKKPDTSEEIRGLIAFVLAVAILLSLVSFGLHGTMTRNWLGVVGNTIGWSFTALFGLGSYLICLYLGWIGWRLLLRKPLEHLFLKTFWFALCVASTCILLSLVEDRYPANIAWLGNTFYPSSWERKIHYHLGGAPFFYLYRDLPGLNLLYIFNALGVTLIFSSTLLASLFFLLKLNPFFLIIGKTLQLFRRIQLPSFPESPSSEVEERPKPRTEPFKLPPAPKEPAFKEKEIERPKDIEKDHVSDFLRYVKLRIPGAPTPAQPGTEPHNTSHQGEMLAIQPESNLTARPSLSRKAQTEKPIEKPAEKLFESKILEKAARPEHRLPRCRCCVARASPKAAPRGSLAAQRVHNGDFTNYKLPSSSFLTNARKTDHSSLKKDLSAKPKYLKRRCLVLASKPK